MSLNVCYSLSLSLSSENEIWTNQMDGTWTYIERFKRCNMFKSYYFLELRGVDGKKRFVIFLIFYSFILKWSFNSYGLASDVFSFAVTLSELISNRLPWADISNINAAMNVVGVSDFVSIFLLTNIFNRVKEHHYQTMLINFCWNVSNFVGNKMHLSALRCVMLFECLNQLIYRILLQQPLHLQQQRQRQICKLKKMMITIWLILWLTVRSRNR